MQAFLRKVPLFADLNDEDLQRLCEKVQEKSLKGGQVLFQEGSLGDRIYIIVEGALEVLKTSQGRDVLLAVRERGEVIGEMALTHEAPRMATVRARSDSKLYSLSHNQFDEILNTSPSAARAMLQTVSARLRSTEAMLSQSRKMAQLGTLTAGVAHELNNPAAAVQRGSEQLRDNLADLATAIQRVTPLLEKESNLQLLARLEAEAKQKAGEPLSMDPLSRSDRETEIEEQLASAGIDNPWDLAPNLVNLDFKPGDLASLEEALSTDALQPVLYWLGLTYAVHSLTEEIFQGAKQISAIVRSLKSYSYLDQAPIQNVDIHEGLDNTLVLLRNKLKDGITVHRKYGTDLPVIQAYGSELNQVWTNLIDNAIDAFEGKGEIILQTRKDDQWVVVEVIDNGPGIPESIQSKIFDPFFTTKGPGKGTGLGLDISYNIIVKKHRGDIRVTSKSGFTCFEVWLPINFEAVSSGTAPLPGIERAEAETIKEILESAKTIAVVGISSRSDRTAHTVPAYLKDHHYRIFPVNPTLETVLGEKSYPDLKSIPETIDVVQIFRPPSEVPDIVDQAIEIGAKAIWMQEGTVNEQAAANARDSGLKVVMDACMRTEHRRLFDPT